MGCSQMCRILTGSHVIGMNYNYVTSCNHNRRAFVWSSISAFSSFPSDSEVALLDIFHLLRLICSDFPRPLIEDAFRVLSLGPGTGKSSYSFMNSQNSKFPLTSCQVAIYFNVVYGEWMKLVDAYFQAQGSSTDKNGSCGIVYTHQSLTKLQQQLSNWRFELKKQLQHPSQKALEQIMKSELSNVSGFSTNKLYSLDQFRKQLYVNEIIADDLLRRPPSTLPPATSSA
jgi:hypothetical protein